VWSNAVLLLAMTALACSAPSRPTRIAPPPGASDEIVAACRLAENRCSRCHPVDRVLFARVESPQHWEWYVARMRRQPGSGISEDDARTIVRCLVTRSFGAAALEEGGP
jgi:hypothetical protein